MLLRRIASTSRVIASWLVMLVLLALGLGALLVARGRLSGISPVDQVGAALQRLAMIAVTDTAQMGLLVLVCAAFGLLVIVDRRRRSRVRQASC